MIDGRFDEGLIVAFSPRADEAEGADDRWVMASALTGVATIVTLMLCAILAG